MQDRIAHASVRVHAPANKVWDALTEPELIEKYFFGTKVETDWKPGSAVVFKGSYKGKSYQDKGEVLECVPNKRLVHTYWSSMAGEPDRPENYKTVSYELKPAADGTLLTLTQDHNASEDARQHSEQNWQQVLRRLKRVVE
ncbi:MAG TPA: SRPBCC family protein [Gammaproteobacteria bacterium]|jgi:uncharacterized protein YndB with AHSA1/START domain